jgi:hypothetical protein
MDRRGQAASEEPFEEVEVEVEVDGEVDFPQKRSRPSLVDDDIDAAGHSSDEELPVARPHSALSRRGSVHADQSRGSRTPDALADEAGTASFLDIVGYGLVTPHEMLNFLKFICIFCPLNFARFLTQSSRSQPLYCVQWPREARRSQVSICMPKRFS